MRVTRPLIVHRSSELSLPHVPLWHITSVDVRSRSLHLAAHTSLSLVYYIETASRIYHIHCVKVIQNGLQSVVSLNKVANLATTFETTLVAAVGKFKICHHPLQVSNKNIHVYPAALQLKLLPMKPWRLHPLKLLH